MIIYGQDDWIYNTKGALKNAVKLIVSKKYLVVT